MELFCLGIISVACLVLVILQQEETAINVQDYMKQLPQPSTEAAPRLRAVSGMVAQRVRQQELRSVVTQDPENAAQTVKLWIRE